MTRRRRRSRHVRFYGWMALAHVTVIVSGSLTPFILRRGPVPEWTAVLRYMWSVPVDPVDAVANVLLFLPLGFLLTAISGSRSVAAFRPVLATVACALLSWAIEVAQVFAAYRYPSVSDVVLNTLGATLGAALWMAIGRNVTALLWLGLRRIGLWKGLGKRARIITLGWTIGMMVWSWQ